MKELVNLTNFTYVIRNASFFEVMGVYKFYTTICIIIQILYYLNIITINPNILLSIITTCSIGGSYLTYYYPKYLCLKTKNIDIFVDGKIMKTVDYITHHLPFMIFIYFNFNNLCFHNFDLLYMLLIPTLYRLCINPYTIYKISLIEQIIFNILSIIITYFIYYLSYIHNLQINYM
jgi:hypothetical protein